MSTRTTLVMEAGVHFRLKELARQEGRLLQDCTNEVLLLGLEAKERGAAAVAPLPTFSFGGARVDVADCDALYDFMDEPPGGHQP